MWLAQGSDVLRYKSTLGLVLSAFLSSSVGHCHWIHHQKSWHLLFFHFTHLSFNPIILELLTLLKIYPSSALDNPPFSYSAIYKELLASLKRKLVCSTWFSNNLIFTCCHIYWKQPIMSDWHCSSSSYMRSETHMNHWHFFKLVVTCEQLLIRELKCVFTITPYTSQKRSSPNTTLLPYHWVWISLNGTSSAL